MSFERVSREDKKCSWLDFAQFASISRPDADRFLAQTRSMQLRELANCRDKEGQPWIRLFSSIDHFCPETNGDVTSTRMHVVFVYGTLRRGQGNHYLLNPSQFIGMAKTKSR
jgi:hypothetical protein